MSTLPKPPAEVPVERDLIYCAPRLVSAVKLVVADLEAWGYDPLVFETIRTQERQAFLHGFSRQYDDGRGRVTNSHDADESWHFYGLAVDIVSQSRYWNAPRDFWRTLGLAAQRHGLRWGADWDHDGDTGDERFKDFPHVQWGPPMRRSPSAAARRLYDIGGRPRVWREVGAG